MDEEEDKKEAGYFYCRGFWTKYKTSIACNHLKIVFLSAILAGRAIGGDEPIATSLLFKPPINS